MLLLTSGQTAEELIVTLTELKTLDDPYYLFIFTHTLTKQTVAFIKAPGDDESLHPERYNKYTINTSVVFTGKPVGEWLYSVYEQTSAVNLVSSLATGLVEQGKMQLSRVADFEYEKYAGTTSFKSYTG